MEIILKPDLYSFDTCKEFVDAFNPGERDLFFTNEYIYNPYFGQMGLKVKTIFQEKYGAGEPTDVMVEAILADAAKLEYDRIFAIGGGTIIDIAKVMAVTDGTEVDPLYDNMAGLKKRFELIIIPTTCGTGSEVTNISILNRTRLNTKMGLVSGEMYANSAVLVPELLNSLPFGVFATSSIDALVHAVESALSPKATAFTKLFSYKAITMIIQGYQRMVKEGLDARQDMLKDFLIASNFAGIAFGTAGCAAVHAMSYPLGGAYHVPHGESNYAMFTGVLKNYMEIKTDGEIAVLNAYLCDLLDCDVSVVYDKLEELLNAILQKKALHEYGVKEEELDAFTESVITQQTRLMNNNFVPLDAKRVRKIYQELY